MWCVAAHHIHILSDSYLKVYMKYTTSRKIESTVLHTLFEQILRAEVSQDVDFLHRIFQNIWENPDEDPSFEEYEGLERALLFRYYGYYLSSYGKAKNLSSYQERGKNLLTKSIELFSVLNETEQALEAQIILGLCYFYESSFSESEAIFDNISNHFEGNHLHPVYLRTQLNMVLVLHWKGEFQKALEILEEIEVPMEFCEDARVLTMYHNQAGLIYRGINQFDRAIYHYNKCIEIAQQENNTMLVGKIYNNMAFLYKNLENFDIAHLYIDKAVQSFRNLNHLGWLPHTLDTKAVICLEERKFDSALLIIDEAISMFRKGEDFAGLCDALWNKIRSLLGLNRKIDAIAEFAMLYQLAQMRIGEYAAIKYSKLFSEAIYTKQNLPLNAELQKFKEAEISDALRRNKYKFEDTAKSLGLSSSEQLNRIVSEEFPHLLEDFAIKQSFKQLELRHSESEKDTSAPKKVNKIELTSVSILPPSGDSALSLEQTKTFYLSFEIMEIFGIKEDAIVLTNKNSQPAAGKFVISRKQDSKDYIFGQFLHDTNFDISYVLSDDEPFPTDEIEIVGELIGYAPFTETDKPQIKFSVFPTS